MTLDEAVAAVAETLTSVHLRVDRRRARQDASSYLLLVLDTGGRDGDGGPVANGPRLVDKATGKADEADGARRRRARGTHPSSEAPVVPPPTRVRSMALHSGSRHDAAPEEPARSSNAIITEANPSLAARG